MKYFKIPVINGEIDFDYYKCHPTKTFTKDGFVYCEFSDNSFTKKDSWEEITTAYYMDVVGHTFDEEVTEEVVEDKTTLKEISENQIAIMQALADVYEWRMLG